MPTSETVEQQLADLLAELDTALAEIRKLKAALELSQAQNYCSDCGRGLDSSYIP